MLEDTFLLVEAKQDLSREALVQTNLIVLLRECLAVAAYRYSLTFTLHDWHVACACLGVSPPLTCGALVISPCPAALL